MMCKHDWHIKDRVEWKPTTISRASYFLTPIVIAMLSFIYLIDSTAAGDLVTEGWFPHPLTIMFGVLTGGTVGIMIVVVIFLPLWEKIEKAKELQDRICLKCNLVELGATEARGIQAAKDKAEEDKAKVRQDLCNAATKVYKKRQKMWKMAQGEEDAEDN